MRLRAGMGMGLALAIAGLASPALADSHAAQQYQNLLTPLLETGTDVIGTTLAYPDGPVAITAAIVTIPPGGETGWHTHEVPLFGYVLEGELTVDYGEKGTKTFATGEALVDAFNWPHNGTNSGSGTLKLIAVYMGGGDAANVVRVPAP